MKRILFGLLVAGVALSASAFTTFTTYTFYNAGSPSSTNPADYVYIPGDLCETQPADNCSVTIDLSSPPTANVTTLNDLIPVVVPDASNIEKGSYQP